MAHRRYHTKTRDGCAQCKHSRIRCDKVKPSCSKCVRKGVICSLADPSSSLIVIATTGSPSKASPQQPQQEEAKAVSASDGTPTVVDVSSGTPSERTDHYSNSHGGESGGSSHFTSAERDNLRLMNHYTCHTYLAIASRTAATQEEVHLWREYVPQLAFEHDYLLHGLLGLSSLHLSLSLPLSQPSSTQQQQQRQHEHALLAIRHHNAGIVAFRAQLAHNITVDNIDALFASSCILVLHSFGIYRCRAVPSPLDPIARVHEVLTLLGGCRVIVRSGYRWLEQSPMSAALMPLPADPTHQLTAAAQGVLAELTRRIDTTPATSTAVHGDLYAAAIATLRHNLVVATERPDDILAIVLFPVMVPPEFLVLVALREPLALAILANYAVVLHWLSAHIWLEGWGKQVIDAVHDALPEDWRQCTAWAVQETRNR